MELGACRQILSEESLSMAEDASKLVNEFKVPGFLQLKKLGWVKGAVFSF